MWHGITLSIVKHTPYNCCNVLLTCAVTPCTSHSWYVRVYVHVFLDAPWQWRHDNKEGSTILNTLPTSKSTNIKSVMKYMGKELLYEVRGSLWKEALSTPYATKLWLTFNISLWRCFSMWNLWFYEMNETANYRYWCDQVKQKLVPKLNTDTVIKQYWKYIVLLPSIYMLVILMNKAYLNKKNIIWFESYLQHLSIYFVHMEWSRQRLWPRGRGVRMSTW